MMNKPCEHCRSTATARRQATQDAMVNRRRNQWVYNSRGWRAYEAAYLMMRYKMEGVK